MSFTRLFRAFGLTTAMAAQSACVGAGPAGAASGMAQVTPVVPAQVTYQLTVTTRGTSVHTAGSPDDAIFGSLTLACLDRGHAAIVGRDGRHLVYYVAVINTPPSGDLALRPYSRAFSELRRIAWNVCAPDQPLASGEERAVAQKGTTVVGGFAFPNDITIQDRLGSIGCEAAPSDKTGRAIPCTSNEVPQPFVSMLTRTIAQ